jgi:hypothetical protein
MAPTSLGYAALLCNGDQWPVVPFAGELELATAGLLRGVQHDAVERAVAFRNAVQNPEREPERSGANV